MKNAANIISRFWRLPRRYPCDVAVNLRMVAGNTPIWTASIVVGSRWHYVEKRTQSAACKAILDIAHDIFPKGLKE